jgi:hypothetical protein
MGTLDEVSSCQGVVGAENFDVLQGKRTTCRITRGNLFILTNNHHIAITADSEIGHEDAERGELCVESRKRGRTFLFSRGERESSGRKR